MKNIVCFFALLSVILSAACDKESTNDSPIAEPIVYDYSQALEKMGIFHDSVYGYGVSGLPDWTPEGILMFNLDGTISESAAPYTDTLTFSLGARVLQPNGTPLPEIVFFSEDPDGHSALTNSLKWQDLDFLRYTTDSAHLQNHFPTLIFRSLSPNKYEGDMEIRKM